MAEFIIPDDAAWAASERKQTTPRAVSARFDRRTGNVTVGLDTGVAFVFDPTRVRGLEKHGGEDFVGITVEGAGGTLHFPRIDAHYSVGGLLETFVGPMEWTRREARAEASRRNGAKGGRPRKAAA